MTTAKSHSLGQLVHTVRGTRRQIVASKLHTTRLLTSLISLFLIVLASGSWAQTAPRGANRPGAADTPEAQQLPRRVAIRFLTDNDFPPFNYLDEDNTLTGFNVEIARALCLELAAACDIQARPWDQLLTVLKRGEADAVIASHAVNPKLLSEFAVTDRYYHTPARFVAKRGGPARTFTPEGLDGAKIAVAKGTAHEAYLRTFFTLSAIQPYENIELARDAVVTGAADALFDDGIALVFWLNGTSSKACCEFKGGAFVEPKYFGDGVGITIQKSDTQLQGLLNAALKRLRDTGRFDELVLRYFPLRAY
jgi:polar amino acid transport system substrate-binding protein